MNPVELLNAWGASWFGFMTGALIDASVLLGLILVVWLPLRRRVSAQLAHGLFCLVLLKLIVPVPIGWSWWQSLTSARSAAPAPLAVVATAPPARVVLPTTGDVGASLMDPSTPEPLAIAEPPAPPAGTRSMAGASSVSAAGTALSVQAGLMLGWASIVALLLARLLRATRRTHRLMREAVPLRPEWLSIDVQALPRTLGLRTPVRWAVSHQLNSPAVGGLVRAAVIIPPDLNDSLTPKQLTWVLLHELAHVRRGDLWVVLVQRVVQAVFFFHPAVHLANWLIDEVREYACDDVALSACKTSRRVCGEGFLAIVERSVEPVAAAVPVLGLFDSRLLIRRRLIRILDNRRTVHARLSPSAAVGLLLLTLVVLPFGRPRDVSAAPGSHLRALGNETFAVGKPAIGLEEPTSYRPGVIWHRQRQASPDRDRAAGEKPVWAGRTVVLSLAYAPDGSILASAGDDAVVLLRDLASGGIIGRLEGHHDAISCLAFSPDGKTLATGSYDHTLKLWDVASGREKVELVGHTNWVFAVAFSPDGSSLASAGHDKTVRVWDAVTGRETSRLAGHTASVRAVAFAPGVNGSMLASGGADRSVILWDLRTESPRARLEGHKGSIRALAFAPEGATLATGGEDGEVRLWDVPSGEERAALLGHSDMVTCLAFSPRGGMLATGSLDTTVKLWETPAARERASLQGHRDGVGISALAFAPDARQMATGGFDGSVRLWEPAAPIFSPTACLDYPGEARSLAFSPDGRSLHAAGEAGIARWDVLTGSTITPPGTGDVTAGLLEGPTRGMASVAFSPDGTTIARVGADGVVRIWDAATHAPRNTLKYSECRWVAFSPDGRWLVAAHDRGDVVLWDVAGSRQVGLLKGHRELVRRVAFSPNGGSLATAGKDGMVKLWSLTTRRQTARATLKGDLTPVWSVTYSPDGKTLAVADGLDAPGTVTLWDVATRQVKATLEGHERGVATAVFSPDGKLLASGGWDGTIRLWEVKTGEQRHELTGLNGVTELAFSRDGRLLASAGEGKIVTLWDVESGAEESRLTGFRWPVQSVAFSPDGKLLVTGGGALGNGPGAPGELKVWDVATWSLVRALDGHTRAVLAVAFAPDGVGLASGSLDETIRLWDVRSGRHRLTLGGLSNCVRALAFSRDGRALAWSGRSDGLVSLHDTTTGAELARLVGHSAVVRGIAFAPDGSGLATGGADRTIRLWDLAADEPSE